MLADLFLTLLLLSIIGLVLGLINPSLLNKFSPKKLSRKDITIIFIIAIVVFFVLFGVTADTPQEKNSDESGQKITQSADKKEEKPQNREVQNKEVSQEVEPIDGGWSDWSDWSKCQINPPELECGTSIVLGEMIRTRMCDNPKPTNGGKDCNGISKETKNCKKTYNHGSCPENYVCVDNVCELEMTLGERNALDSAHNYLTMSAFSREGLIEQLEYEGYTHKQAVYAVNNCGADWNEQAVKSAENYLEMSNFSRSGLIEQLEYEGFTSQQAEYGADAVGY